MWKLTRTFQCANCPWKKSADLSQIPGYSPQMHQKLRDTIPNLELDPIEQLKEFLATGELKIMACHESTGNENDKQHCIGWVHNQLINNNIPLRIEMMTCENGGEIEVYGEQYESFKDTLNP